LFLLAAACGPWNREEDQPVPIDELMREFGMDAADQSP
jgi:hypothetical protein